MAGTRRRWIVGLAVAAGCMLATPASATIFSFGKPEKVGTFKVLDGHFKQNVGFLANYKLETPDDCWVYHYQDTGSARYNLKFDKGEVDRFRWTGEDLPLSLFVDGTASRSWSGTVNSEPGPEDDRDQCPPASPLTDNGRACGSAKIKDEVTGFSLLAVKNGRFRPGGPDAAPFGPILRRDPFAARGASNCPSTSLYGLLAIPGISKNGLKELDQAKRGEKVTLNGRADESGPGPTGFAHIGDWVSGAHTAANVNWELKLRRVK